MGACGPSQSDMTQWAPGAGVKKSPRFRLFCFPFAGAGASVYSTWRHLFDREVEVVSVLLPGREERLREPAFDRVEPLLQELEVALRDYLDLPYAFYGHSMGAHVAFYLTRRFRERRLRPPVHLFVGACRAPQLKSRYPMLAQLPPDEFLREIGKRYNGIPPLILQNSEMLRVLLPTLRADFSVFEQTCYVDESPLESPISAYRGNADDVVSREEMEAWAAQTCGRFRYIEIPGTHFFLRSSPGSLVQLLTSELTGEQPHRRHTDDDVGPHE